MPEKLKSSGITGMQLKILAIISMTIDHIGAVIFQDILWMRIVGRIAFPIYCFLLVEGFNYTKSRKKYLVRLLAFAFISEIPFDLAFFGKAFEFGHQNVFFTLFIGFLTMYFCEFASSNLSKYIMCFAGMVLAGIFRTDYSFFGVALIVIFYLFRDDRLSAFILQAVMNIAEGSLQGFAALALIPIGLYKGKQGRKRFQMFFYAYYPVHLVVIYIYSLVMLL